MGIITFYTDNLFDLPASVLSVSSAEANFPKENLLDPMRSLVWRATGDTSEWIKVNLGAAMPFDTFIAINSNGGSAGTYKIEGHATDAWGAPTLNEVITWNSRVLFKTFTQANLQWARHTMADALNPATKLETGRVYLGVGKVPSRSFKWGWSQERKDLSLVTRNPLGPEFSNIRRKYDVFNFSFRVPVADRNLVYELFDDVGIGKDLFIAINVPDAVASDWVYYGKFLDSPRFVQSFANEHEFQIAFKESL